MPLRNFVDGVWPSQFPDEIMCEFGDIRLSGGLSPSEGMVEVCVGGRFLLVVDRVSNAWTQPTSFVICRQLQLPPSGEQ